MTDNLDKFKTLERFENSKFEGGYRLKVGNKENLNSPLITIITATFNSEKYLEESILSLYNQKFSNYEHIIVDGGSTDKTIDIVKKYEDKISYWCSNDDKGIYDAFNKGMMLAKGDYLGFLNSDDVYLPEALMTLKNYVIKENYPDFIFGSVKKHWGVLHGFKPYKIFWSWGFYSSHSTGFLLKENLQKL